jgi:hypothetical protein
MIYPVTGWFEIVELPVGEIPRAGSDLKTQKRVGRTNSKTQEATGQTKEAYFDKSSFMISKLVTAVLVQSVSSLSYVIYILEALFEDPI